MRLFVFISVFLLLPYLGQAQLNKPDTLRASYIEEDIIKLDGQLQELAWEGADKIPNFK
jgi:hypothetical protein